MFHSRGESQNTTTVNIEQSWQKPLQGSLEQLNMRTGPVVCVQFMKVVFLSVPSLSKHTRTCFMVFFLI